MDEEQQRIEKEAEPIRERLQEIGRMVKKELPPGWGFTMLVASHGPKGVTLYISTINRADALQMMREFIANQREERNWFQEMPDLESNEEFDQWWAQQIKRMPNYADNGKVKQMCRDAFLGGRASA